MGDSLNPVFSRRAACRVLAGLPLPLLGIPRNVFASNADPACRRNLHAIHDAVVLYRNQFSRLPPSLGALIDEGLIDARLLVCPERLLRGGVRTGFSSVGRQRKDPSTTYVWMHGDSSDRLTSADFLDRQRRMGAGSWVPLARCGAHGTDAGLTYLNLALNGGIYASGNSWEHQLRDIIPFPYLRAIALIEAEPLIPLKDRIPPRTPTAGPAQIDLGEVFNGALTDPWPEGITGEEAPGLLALGGGNRVLEHGGVKFELRGVVQLEGSKAAAVHELKEARFPAIRQISVTGRANAVHLLCGVIRSQPPGTPALEITLLSGKEVAGRMILRHGAHVVYGNQLLHPENAAIIWSREIPPQLPDDSRAEAAPALSVSHVVMRLEKLTMLSGMRIAALENECYPFLLAITLE